MIVTQTILRKTWFLLKASENDYEVSTPIAAQHEYIKRPVSSHSFPVFDKNFEFILLAHWLSFQVKHQRLKSHKTQLLQMKYEMILRNINYCS